MDAEVAETHTSVVLFIGDVAVKVRKPVDLGFVDLRTLSARRAACHAEVQLNRRLAPDVYRGVFDLVGPDGAVREHAVVMRRLPAAARLSTLVGSGRPVDGELRRLARLLADFHARCARSPRVTGWGSREAVAALWREGLAGLRRAGAGIVEPADIDRTDRLASDYLAGRGPLFAERQRAGRIVDGHGDLLAEDIFCLPDGPRVLDCLEFDPRLRAGDVLLDVAFLAIDLERLGAPAAAASFLAAYHQFSAESHPRSLAEHYVAYRAHVRTKVACLRAGQGDPGAAAEARRLSALGLAHLDRARVRLVLLGGLPGSGKSTVAGGLADRAGWVLLGSDVLRKQRAGLAADTPAPASPDAGLYTPEATAEVYRELAARAAGALARGESVVVDATFGDAGLRELVAGAAARTSSELVELRCSAPAPLCAARLSSRRAGAAAGSDATVAVLDRLAGRFAPWPRAGRVDTAGSPDTAVAAALAAAGWTE